MVTDKLVVPVTFIIYIVADKFVPLKFTTWIVTDEPVVPVTFTVCRVTDKTLVSVQYVYSD